MHKIKLDSPELFDSVRWQEDREEKRQRRREFHEIKISQGIRSRNTKRQLVQQQQYRHEATSNDRYPRKFDNSSKPSTAQVIARKTLNKQKPQGARTNRSLKRKQTKSSISADSRKTSLARAVIVTALRAVKDPHPYRRSIKKKAVAMFSDRTKNFRLAMSTLTAVFVVVMAFNVFAVGDKPLVLGATYGLVGPIPEEPFFDSKLAASQRGTRVSYAEDTIASYTVKGNEGRYLIIPKYNILTRIFRAGSDSIGAVTVPGDVQDVIWYDGSAGFDESSGAALIVGHSDGGENQGVFSDIKYTKLGDKIKIIRGDNLSLEFEVKEIIKTEVGKVDMRNALSPTIPEEFGLNLLTCGGSRAVATEDKQSCYLVKATQIR